MRRYNQRLTGVTDSRDIECGRSVRKKYLNLFYLYSFIRGEVIAFIRSVAMTSVKTYLKRFLLKRYLKRTFPNSRIAFLNRDNYGEEKELLISLPESNNIEKKKADIKVVDILNLNFYDWNGKEIYRGGAERYIIDLAKIIKQTGHDARIIQNANRYFEKEYDGLKVIGIPAQSKWNLKKLSRYYLKEFQHSEYTICSPLELACKLKRNLVRSLGINHGVHWDSAHNRLYFSSDRVHKILFNALKNVDLCICVDTNFINWVRTCDYGLSRKLMYIPNYFDPNQFMHRQKAFSDDEIVIVYPRRLYLARGFYLVLELIDRLLPLYKNVKFHFVGQVSAPETEILEDYLRRYPDRILHYSLDFAEMHSAYKDSQIVLIPTLHSEGTSLSCIEAMATNNAVVATNVGGLPNLIIDQYNGLLISPNVEDLSKAVIYLLDNRDARMRLARNAAETAKSFSKNNWEEKWVKILENFLR